MNLYERSTEDQRARWGEVRYTSPVIVDAIFHQTDSLQTAQKIWDDPAPEQYQSVLDYLKANSAPEESHPWGVETITV